MNYILEELARRARADLTEALRANPANSTRKAFDAHLNACMDLAVFLTTAIIAVSIFMMRAAGLSFVAILDSPMKLLVYPALLGTGAAIWIIVAGWWAKQVKAAVRARFQAL